MRKKVIMARLGIDTGGTFTDAVLLDDEGNMLGTCKVPSDNGNPANAVFNAACRVCEQCGIDLHDVRDLVHGTTVATNVSLEENGPRIALITTKGFRDVLEIGRLTRPASALYDLMDAGRKPLVARRDRFEVTERIDKDGAVLEELSEAEVREAVAVARSRGITSVAVCFLFSFINPAHELRAREVIRRVAPEMDISLSCEILPQVREYERTSAAAINAYLQPVCKPYLRTLQDKFRDSGVDANIWVMQSNGGVTSPEDASENPINLLMSGPSGGVVAVKDIARRLGLGDVISVDMGGTSFDVSCIIGGDVPLTSSGETMNMPLRIPTIDISTIGTGGGSIAFSDVAGQLHVGPRSAGARPGPASYGHGGTEPTVTDANVVIGYIPDGERLGRDIVVSREAAVAACEPLAACLGISVLELAYGIRRISTSAMAGAVREISVGKGRDPRSFSLLAFGGAGPLHAVDIARAMGIMKVVVPKAAGVLSALGLVSSSAVRTFTKSMMGLAQDAPAIGNAANGLLAKAHEFNEGLPAGEMTFSFIFDMRYAGQNSTIPVAIADPFSSSIETDAAEEFNKRHEALNGYASYESDVMIDAVNLVFSKSIVAKRCYVPAFDAPGVTIEPIATRTVWRPDGSAVELPVIDLDRVVSPGAVEVPCVIASSTTTIVVPEYSSCIIDAEGNVVIEVEE